MRDRQQLVKEADEERELAKERVIGALADKLGYDCSDPFIVRCRYDTLEDLCTGEKHFKLWKWLTKTILPEDLFDDPGIMKDWPGPICEATSEDFALWDLDYDELMLTDDELMDKIHK